MRTPAPLFGRVYALFRSLQNAAPYCRYNAGACVLVDIDTPQLSAGFDLSGDQPNAIDACAVRIVDHGCHVLPWNAIVRLNE